MFIAMNRFRIVKGEEAAFERIWAERDTYLAEVPGFVAFHLLRGPEAEDHTLYASHTVWASARHFEDWTKSEAFRKAHPGAGGAKKLIEALSRGEHLGMLVDQKLNEGIAVPFFGRDAMTAPALAQLALRFGCPVVPARVERLDGAHFRLTVYPPLTLATSGDRQADIAAAMGQINALIEEWIRARPEQWLWLHRRWPD